MGLIPSTSSLPTLPHPVMEREFQGNVANFISITNTFNFAGTSKWTIIGEFQSHPDAIDDHAIFEMNNTQILAFYIDNPTDHVEFFYNNIQVISESGLVVQDRRMLGFVTCDGNNEIRQVLFEVPQNYIIGDTQVTVSGTPTASNIQIGRRTTGQDELEGFVSHIAVILKYFTLQDMWKIVKERANILKHMDNIHFYFPMFGTSPELDLGPQKLSGTVGGTAYEIRIAPKFSQLHTDSILIAPSAGAGTPVSNSLTLAWEALQTVVPARQAVWESLDTNEVSRQALWEALLGLDNAGVTLWESLEGVETAESSRWESLQSLAQVAVALWESTQGIEQGETVLWESVGEGVANILTVLYESLEGIEPSHTSLWESLDSISSISQEQWESILSAENVGINLYESLQSIINPITNLYESKGLITSPYELPYESGESITQISQALYESISSISTFHNVSFESVSSIVAALTVLWETSGEIIEPQRIALQNPALKRAVVNNIKLLRAIIQTPKI